MEANLHKEFHTAAKKACLRRLFQLQINLTGDQLGYLLTYPINLFAFLFSIAVFN